MLDGHPFNFPLFELYCAPIYAPIAHHFFMNVRKHLSSFKSLQAQKMRYSFIFNDLCQTAKNSVRCVTNHNAQFHLYSQLLCCLAHLICCLSKKPDTITDYNTPLPFSQGKSGFSLRFPAQITNFGRFSGSKSARLPCFGFPICRPSGTLGIFSKEPVIHSTCAR